MLLLVSICFSCNAHKLISQRVESEDSAACLADDATQNGMWQRLGTPSTVELTNQVAPSLVVVRDELWVYYSQRDGLNDAIYLIRSSDGKNWREPESISSLNQFSEIMHLNVRMDRDNFVAMIGGGRIGEATSLDGYEWVVTTEQVIPTDEFDSLGQLYPSQSMDGKQLWFSGFNGQTFSIGMAENNYGAWVNKGTVIEAVAESEFANTAVAQSTVWAYEDGYVAWFGGYDTSQTDPGPWRILTAHSSNGENWNDSALALDLTASGEEAWSVREPSVVLWEGQFWMAYVAMGDDGLYRLRLAVCGTV